MPLKTIAEFQIKKAKKGNILSLYVRLWIFIQWAEIFEFMGQGCQEILQPVKFDVRVTFNLSES